jgi:5,10-methylene-tetrahydrofolate dehydrogenase/methenyl tetrahydrofolate cyclohydrolase
MKLVKLALLIGLIVGLVSSCATPPQPIHEFKAYYKYDLEGKQVIVTGDGEHICMPLTDFQLFYEAFNLYYQIEE